MLNTRQQFIKKIRKLPFSVPFFITIVCIYGFIILYSAAKGHIEPWAYKQIKIFCIFMPLSIMIALIDLKIIYRFSYLFYFSILLLLIAVELFGKTAMGATRWIDLGLFRIQPSEPTKIAIVLMLARYFSDECRVNKLSICTLIPPLIAVIIPTLLIIKQPDLGTGIITFLVAIMIFFAVGVRISYFVLAGILVLLSLPVIWSLMYNYQRNRVLIFLDPEKEPLGAGYNIIQSKIAIGSGGLFGKGLLNGTQSHLSFLPEYQTDFIFAFLAEELGFVGGMLLLCLYILIIISALSVSVNCRSRFGKLMAIGITSIFFSHIFINIAMVMGMLPAVGVPLPFISYGGTMMVSMLIGFGLVMNAGVNQTTNI